MCVQVTRSAFVRKITLSLASHASKGSITDKIPMTVGGIFGRHDIRGKMKGNQKWIDRTHQTDW
jgi:hypothetical protein